jgi:nicotinamide-nucleotide amidase
MAIEERVGDVLRDRGESVAAAESCTGGLVSSKITDVAGASDYFDRSYVTYTNAAKLEELGVAREPLDAEGAVSEPVAAAMARGARDGAGVAWGVATTGIAGPTGGTDDKPVGTVYVGVAYGAPWGTGESRCTVERYVFDGSRAEIKAAIADRALADLVGAAEGS